MWNIPRLALRGLLRRKWTLARPVVPAFLMASSVTFKLEDTEAETLERPKDPLSLPPSTLSHEFLLRQSCSLSTEGASRTLTHAVMSVQDCAGEYLVLLAELSNLFEDSVLALTDEGGSRVAELQSRRADLKRTVHDLEMLFIFLKKLLDANAEVCFLVGAEFASTEASHRLHQAETTVQELFNRVKLAELDLTRAQQSHIEKSARIIKEMEEGLHDRKKRKEEDEQVEEKTVEEAEVSSND